MGSYRVVVGSEVALADVVWRLRQTACGEPDARFTVVIPMTHPRHPEVLSRMDELLAVLGCECCELEWLRASAVAEQLDRAGLCVSEVLVEAVPSGAVWGDGQARAEGVFFSAATGPRGSDSPGDSRSFWVWVSSRSASYSPRPSEAEASGAM